ncbi:hypothetical protein PV05_10554 [Exophiala xenobiotica]|uniref:AB hydrolase-1 domain-containing protein n=1 Tax=Exophiala xenobiotica TaxID=348802 RepID=A0A0D2CPI2_9EURO|nr:uncharacterized protein PV05_10554 [Exophiala xenobiotica]KIW51872.1 hypothetical protein PV05_10554 [Exophiala xenobiotica]
MDKLEAKTFTTSRSLEYAYYTSPSKTDSKNHPALLFCHGFPDSAFLWNDVIARLKDLPYKIIAPDMLGYAGTSKPLDTALYAYSGMADDLREILDAEGIGKVIAIGHDWGAVMAQRFYPFYPDRVAGIVLLNVPYHPPSKPGDPKFDLQAINSLLKEMFGAPLWTYWGFFTAEDGPRLMRENLERVYEAQHGDVQDWVFKMFCVPGAWRTYLTGTESVPLKAYAKEKRWRDSFLNQFEKDGFEAPVQWYRAMIENVQYEVECKIPLERHKVDVPVLFVGCTQDANNRADLIEIPQKAGLLPDLEVKVLDCGHWSPMEKPGEVSTCIREFLTSRF